MKIYQVWSTGIEEWIVREENKKGDGLLLRLARHKKSGSKVLKAEYHKNIEENKNMFFDRKKAEKRLKEILEKKQKENEMLNNGHIRCYHCMKIIKREEAVTKTIRSIRNYGKGGKKKKFCSGSCAKNAQFAVEG